MGLSACMWTSVSGLLSHGQKMNVVGNNLANVSTIGFKAQRMDFEDYLYVNKGTASGTKQIGQGSSVYTILGDFSQGAFESTNSVTDIAIDGNGFFKVRKPNSENMFYSRAGDFYFNADRELQNPEGYLLQGWKVNNKKSLTFYTGTTNLGTGHETESPYVGTGSPVDIVLDSWNIIPQRTTNVSFTMGLVNDATSDHTTSETMPMTAIFDLWDGSKEPPIADTAYATQSSIKVYDEGGSTHELTVYYDQILAERTNSNGDTIYKIDGLPAGYTVYEYLVTMPPSEDMRSYGGTYDPATNTVSGETKFYDPAHGTKKMAGALMSGVLIFNASGQLVNQSAYTYGAEDPNAAPDEQCKLNPDDRASWQPTKLSSNGLPVCLANFTGQPLANSVSETMVPAGSTTPISQAQDYIIEIDFGLKDLGNPAWDGSGTSLLSLDTTLQTDPVQILQPSALKVSSLSFPGGDLTADGTYTLTLSNGSIAVVQTDASATPTTTLTYGGALYSVDNITSTTIKGTYSANGITKVLELDFSGTGTLKLTSDSSGSGSQPGTKIETTTTATNTTGTSQTTMYKASYSTLNKMSSSERQESACAANSSTFTTQDCSQDGYGSGVLSNIDIDTAGVVSGLYSNGKTIPLYQIALYDFKCEQGLYREGGNLFAATRESGEPKQGVPGDNGFGFTRAYNIEQSNVDMSTEFVQMISTQRGFQANSKSVTTVDTMLETVIGMKR